MMLTKSILILFLLSNAVLSMAPGRKQINHGKLSEKTRKILEVSLGGMDPKEWKEKIKALREDHQASNVNPRNKRASDDNSSETETANKTEGILDVNEKSGIIDYLYDGDILLTQPQLENMIVHSQAEGVRNKRQIHRYKSKWRNNTVPYFFEDGFSTSTSNLVEHTLAFMESQTCLKFVQSSTAENRIKVVEADGCFSYVGVRYGEQVLSLAPGCDWFGVVAHEFLHALGFIHTQSRYDRDEYVSIVDEKKENLNFYKYDKEDNRNVVGYDYGSVMHYSASAFSESGQLTITPKNIEMLYTLGSEMVSFLDLKALNQYYLCSCSNTLECKNGGYINPSSCESCICPAGYGGKLCDTRPDTCGEILEATEEWKTTIYDVKTKHEYKDQLEICNHWITAPNGTTIEIRLKLDNFYCTHGCVLSGIEPKVELDQITTNPRYCCPEFQNKTLVSQVNPMPVVSWSSHAGTMKQSFSYRYVGTPVTTETTQPASTTTTTVTPTPVSSAQPTTTKVLTIKPNRCSVDLGF